MNNQSINTNLNKFIYSILSVLILLCLVYINETSSLSTQGYVITDYQKELKEYEQYQATLNTEIAQQSSILALNEIASQNSMEKSNPIYINNVDTIVIK